MMALGQSADRPADADRPATLPHARQEAANLAIQQGAPTLACGRGGVGGKRPRTGTSTTEIASIPDELRLGDHARRRDHCTRDSTSSARNPGQRSSESRNGSASVGVRALRLASCPATAPRRSSAARLARSRRRYLRRGAPKGSSRDSLRVSAGGQGLSGKTPRPCPCGAAVEIADLGRLVPRRRGDQQRCPADKSGGRFWRSLPSSSTKPRWASDARGSDRGPVARNRAGAAHQLSQSDRLLPPPGVRAHVLR